MWDYCGIIAWNSPAQPPLSSSQSDCKTALDAGPYGVPILDCKSFILWQVNVTAATKQRSTLDSIGIRKKIAPNVDKLTSAGVALALICACSPGHARLSVLWEALLAVLRIVFLALFVVGFLLARFLIIIPTRKLVPLIQRTARRRCTKASFTRCNPSRNASHYYSYYFPLSLATSPTLFPHFPASPRAFLSKRFFDNIHSVTRSSVATRPTSRLDISRLFRFEQRPKEPCRPLLHSNHLFAITHINHHLPPRSFSSL